MRWGILVMLAACGRVGFGSIDPSDDGSPGDDGASDALGDPCAAGDGICRTSCVASDPDCMTTCGDGTCVGNAGELCTNCLECKTTQAVCGNGACDPGENSDVCYADCGPTPWPWGVDEADLLARINAIRTGGYTCPGGSATTAPALTAIESLTGGAREIAWEYAYQQFAGGAASCNGRTLDERVTAAGTTTGWGMWLTIGSATSSDAFDAFVVDMAACTSLMNAAYTRIGIGVAHGTPNCAAIILD